MPILSGETALIRLTEARYSDGLGAMEFSNDPALIARLLFDQEGAMPNSSELSALFVSWGQFIDHDMSLTRDASGEEVHVEGLVAGIERSVHTFDDAGVRNPLNEITPEMDGSMIYGSTVARENAVRSFEGGRLRSQTDASGQGEVLPFATMSEPMAGMGAFENMFLAGDLRANENTGLLTLHTLMMREHNHWADYFADLSPAWNDAQIFQAARAVVEAEIQAITYDQWLPLLLGDAQASAITAAKSFDATIDGQVSVEFSTAAFRFGHTMVASALSNLNEDGSDAGGLTVREAFFNTTTVAQGGLSGLLRGQMSDMAQEADAKVIDDLNMFLTGPNGVTGFSLAALNILRGYDHGLGSYLEVREALLGDIDPAAIADDDFSVITDHAGLQAELASVYASVQDVDLWVGGLAEDPLEGAQTGALFAHIIAEQFLRTQNADESFGLLSLDLPQTQIDALYAEISQTSLRDIIIRNSDVANVQSDVFKAALRMAGTSQADILDGTDNADLIMGFAGDDSLHAGRGDDSVFAGDGQDVVFGGAGNDLLEGGAEDDKLAGGRGADTLNGGTGSDRLVGGNGQDLLTGGDGHDRLSGGDANDRLDGGKGDDILTGGMARDQLDGGAGNDLLYGGEGEDILIGGDGADRLMGSAGADRLTGGDGDDLLRAGRSDDIALGGIGADKIYGGRGHDRLEGGDGNDLLRGEMGCDTLFGGVGNDRLDAGAGHDSLEGGAGDDILIGGSGMDTFVFRTGFGVDRIDDYEIGRDVVQLELEGVTSFADIASAMMQNGRHLYITVGLDEITLRNVQADDLSADDFLFL